METAIAVPRVLDWVLGVDLPLDNHLWTECLTLMERSHTGL